MVSARTILAVVGATGTGKSAFADRLALEHDGEVVSADSMQVYKGMDIGTAKVFPGERSVPYHCLDLVAPDEPFNAALYQKAARAAIEDILARGKQPVVCGGTGLYVRAALDDFDLSHCQYEHLQSSASNDLCEDDHLRFSASGASIKPQLDSRSQRRRALETEAAHLGATAFHAKLTAIDPDSAVLIHPHNVRRVVRAFEWLAEGSSYAVQASGFDAYTSFYPTRYIGLAVERAELYERINNRVDAMLAAGLVQEVQGLVDAGFAQALTALQAIGYKEILPVLAGEATLEAAAQQIKKATRNYAKRQIAWFKRDKRIQYCS